MEMNGRKGVYETLFVLLHRPRSREESAVLDRLCRHSLDMQDQRSVAIHDKLWRRWLRMTIRAKQRWLDKVDIFGARMCPEADS
jgi:hypothetical protein